MGAQAGGVWGQEAGVSLLAAWWVHMLLSAAVSICLCVCLVLAAARIRLYDTFVLLLDQSCRVGASRHPEVA